MENNNEREILNGVQSQISSFDNKASILLSVVGIIFALTLSFLDVFHSEFFKEKNNVFKGFYYSIFIAYILVTISLIVMLILVIFPRKHKNEKKYPNYYNDIIKMSEDELKKSINNYSKENELIIDQIKINSKICSIKHHFLKIGIILFIPFIISIFLMIIMVMCA